MIDEKSFQSYVDQTQELAVLSDENPKAYNDLLGFVDRKMKELGRDKAYKHFFKAEKAFYNRQYKLALKHYSLARDVPNFRFFCHRATAMVYHKNQRVEDAINYAKKALNIYPTDYVTLRALEGMFRQTSQESEAEKVKNQISSLSKESKELKDVPEEVLANVSLGQEELDDLEGLFENGDLSSPELLKPQEREWSSELDKDVPLDFLEGDFSFSEDLDEGLEDLLSDRKPRSRMNINRGAFEDLERLSQKGQDISEKSASGIQQTWSSASPLIHDVVEESLDRRVESFQREQSKLISCYVDQAQKRENLGQDFFFVLDGWDYRKNQGNLEKISFDRKSASLLLPEYRRKTCGGFYYRWNGKGIVVNPGMYFLENFHQQDLFVGDIDYVIVTRLNQDAYADVKGIYDLNYQHNTVSKEVHVIQYYLNQGAYHDIGTALMPRFKQERNAVHCLELYIDSPDVERVELDDDIILEYFQAVALKNTCDGHLGIRLELSTEASSKSLNIGFVSGLSCTESLLARLKGSEIIFAGFGSTSADDYACMKYNSDSLGYFGTFTLAKELRPRLLVCSEFSGREGDIRVEVIKKMRKELKELGGHQTVLLPGDTGMHFDMRSLTIECSVSRHFVDPTKMCLAKSSEAFGALQYLCPSCVV